MSEIISSGPLEGVEITADYLRIRDLLDQHEPITLVCGKAGTGKSTLIQYITNYLKRPNTVVVAPTGVAALNVGGMTIHSFFKFPPRLLSLGEIGAVSRPEVYKALDLLIIDEVSMVRADMLDAIDFFLRMNRTKDYLPFGGVQVLMVGDMFQLPPVVKAKEERAWLESKYKTTNPLFWRSDVIQQNGMMIVELERIFRQTDIEFCDILNHIRIGKDLETVVPRINTIGMAVKPEDPLITLTSTNATAETLNTHKLAELSTPEHTFHGIVEGEFKEDRLPAPLDLHLKVGAQVMFVRNDSQKQWVNGTLGEVVGFDFENEQIEIELRETGREGVCVKVPETTWDMLRYDYSLKERKITSSTIGRYTQYPLMLAWAITIHKSQGKTLERVRIDLGWGAFAPGQVYVALSRCRTPQDVSFTRPLREEEVYCDPDMKSFQRGIDTNKHTGVVAFCKAHTLFEQAE